MSKEENKREYKEKVNPPSDRVGKKEQDKNVGVRVDSKEPPKMTTMTTQPGVKRPSPGTSFSFGSKKKQSGISIQLQSQNRKATESKLVPKLGAAAAAFNDEHTRKDGIIFIAKLVNKADTNVINQPLVNSTSNVTVDSRKQSTVGDDGVNSDEEEEMPLEAKLRMKNIGKGTPTASGPNSFGKTSQGFTNERRVWDMKLIDETRTPAT